MITLQNIVFPEPEIGSETALYFGLSGGATFDSKNERLDFDTQGAADFGTYFNLFSVGKWAGACRLDGLFLMLCGEGKFTLCVTLTTDGLTRRTLLEKTVRLEAGQEVSCDLSDGLGSSGDILSFTLTAHSNGCFSGARFRTKSKETPLPALAICITTYRREAAIDRTMDRLADFLAGYECRDKISVFVIDNAQSLPPSAHEKITIIGNPNVGGSGGFARGLLTAENAGASHCLFMDDDATFHLENIVRTYAFLRLAHDARTAVAGAMISNSCPSRMWENGATFYRRCHPVSNGVDLTEFRGVVTMEQQSCAPRPAHFYGGWWFFAFPVAKVEHYPFPFFVRGDDINFSLSNTLDIQTLSGVVAFQDDFSEKENARTLYLDLRNHLVQHLTLDALKIGRWNATRIALWFLFRNAAMFRYETCEALLLAWRDVMQGPAFFARNARMTERFALLKTLVKEECPRPLATLDLKERRRLPRGLTCSGLGALLWKWTLNGHLVPFFEVASNHVVISTTEHGHFRRVWGASRVTYVGPTKGYVVRISRMKFLGLMWHSLAAGAHFMLIYPRLQVAYRQSHPNLTTRAFWQGLLKSDRESNPKDRPPE